MKRILLAHVLFLLVCGFPIAASAEATYPDWDKICAEDQREWGFRVYRSDSPQWPTLAITVPPALRDVCRRARLYLKHRGDSKHRVEVNAALMPQEDGSAKISIDLWETSFDDSELILYVDTRAYKGQVTSALLAPRLKDCASPSGDFDGFTFRIPAAK